MIKMIVAAFGKPYSVLSEKALTEKIASKTRESVELSSRDRSFERGNDSHRNTTSSRTLFARVGRFSETGQNIKCGMILPFEPHSIAFDEIKYAADMPQGVSGAFRPTAIMGVSGAGKTTLMDVLSGRKTGRYMNGRITIPSCPKEARNVCSYVRIL